MKKYIYKRNFIPIYDTEAMAEYFSEMSEKGMFIHKFAGNGNFAFMKGNPQKLYYCIDLFKPEKHQDINEYISICESSGWKFISYSQELNVLIFYSQNPSLTPIQSDSKIKSACIERAVKRKSNGLFLVNIVFFVVFWGIFLFSYILIPVSLYSVGSVIFIYFLFINIPGLFISITQFLGYKKYVRKVRNNIPLQRISPKEYNKKGWSVTISYLCVMFLAVIITFINLVSFVFAVPPTPEELSSEIKIISIESFDNINGSSVDKSVSCDNIGLFIKESYNYDQEQEYGLDIYINYNEFTFSFIAKDVYSRIHLCDSIIFNTEYLNFSKEDCEKMNIDKGKYSYAENSYIIYIVKDNHLYDIRISAYDSDNLRKLPDIDTIKENIHFS